MKRKWASQLLLLRQIVLTLSLVAVLYILWSERKELPRNFNLGLPELLSIVGLLCTYHFFYSWRFKLALEKSSSLGLPHLGLFRLLIISRFLNIFVPQAGNVYRGVCLKQDYGISYGDYVAAYGTFLWLDALFNLCLAISLLLLRDPTLTIQGFPAAQVLFALLLLIISPPFILALAAPLCRAPKTLPVPRGIQKLLAVVYQAFINARDLKFIAVFSVLSAVCFWAMAGIFYLLFSGFNFHLGLASLALFYALYRLTFVLSVTPGNWGVNEIAWGYLSSQLGTSVAEGILLSLALRLVDYPLLTALGIATGGFYVLSRRNLQKDTAARNISVPPVSRSVKR